MRSRCRRDTTPGHGNLTDQRDDYLSMTSVITVTMVAAKMAAASFADAFT